MEGEITHFPEGARFEIPESKISGYLLSRSHAVGEAKARVFLSIGLNSNSLRQQLSEIVRRNPIASQFDTEYGAKYLVDGMVEGETGVRMAIRTVWIKEHGKKEIRFVTAYPKR